MKQAGVAAGGQAGRKSQAVTAADFPRIGDMLRNQLTGGRIHTLSAPMSAEGDEFPDLQRLVLKYNYGSIGRLRLMIDAINDEE